MRRRTLSTLVMVIAFASGMAQPALQGASAEEMGARPLKLTFRNVTPEQGTLWVSVCTEDQIAARYKGEPTTCAAEAKVPAKNGASVVFDDLAPGTYAATAFHDDNDNGRLDFDDRGIPFEATGNAQNARGSYGPPTFEQMQFELAPASVDPSPLTFSIRLYKVAADF